MSVRWNLRYRAHRRVKREGRGELLVGPCRNLLRVLSIAAHDRERGGVDGLAHRKVRVGRGGDGVGHLLPAGDAVRGHKVLWAPIVDRAHQALAAQVEHDPGIGRALPVRDPVHVALAVVPVDDPVRHGLAVARGEVGVDAHLFVGHQARIALGGGERERQGIGCGREARGGGPYLHRMVPRVRARRVERFPCPAVGAHLQPGGHLAVEEVTAMLEVAVARPTASAAAPSRRFGDAGSDGAGAMRGSEVASGGKRRSSAALRDVVRLKCRAILPELPCGGDGFMRTAAGGPAPPCALVPRHRPCHEGRTLTARLNVRRAVRVRPFWHASWRGRVRGAGAHRP